jgi:sortase A
VLTTLGMVVLLFVFYLLYVSNWISAAKQRDATAQLDKQWRNPRGTLNRPVRGDGIAKLSVPVFGPDFVWTVLQGTDQSTLAVGPGHYPDTAMPGEPGNFSVGGHRVGKGSPFNDLDLLGSCDALVVETVDTWFVYRVLPTRDEAAGWAQGKGNDPRCRQVAPLPGAYSEVVGQEIVLPSKREVIAPVPGWPGLVLPPEQQRAMITLTTCHPKFSARQRLIIHGVLVAQYPKNAGAPPAELRTN